jgi:hypothetical protein
MALKIITITIDHEGDQTVETAGYQGKGCQAVLDVFARAVGTVEKTVHKPEYNKPAVNTNLVRH